MICRNLDGYYFKVERSSGWERVCFSDLTEEEMDRVLDSRTKNWLRALCRGLARNLHNLGDEYGIVKEARRDR